MLTEPRYPRVGERCADGETETLELKTLKNLPLEDRHPGVLPHMFIPGKEVRKHENITVLQKRIGNIVICTNMCMTKT